MQKNLPEVAVVITDTSCLILLKKLNALHLLNHLYSTIITTPEVANEFGETLPSWIEIKRSDSVLTETFKSNIDEGEASAIALALEIHADILITDDAKARKFAELHNLNVKGSAGVLLMAKQVGLISELKPFFDAIKNTNFRVAPSILESILRQAGE